MRDVRAENLDAQQRELYELALAARKRAYAPYSHFAVGAVVRCADGRCYSGCNVENASYGLSCCGERNAIFAAVGAGQRQLECLCVAADTPAPVSPCGACRQVMNEFKIKTILLGNLHGDIKICTPEDLLPYGFTL